MFDTIVMANLVSWFFDFWRNVVQS
jgi:hypothetical protein